MTKNEKILIDEYFNEQYNLYHESIFKLCMARLNCNVEAAEDCTQDAFIVLYKRLKQGETFESPRAFLYKSAINFINKFIDKKVKKSKNEISLYDDTTLEITSNNEKADDNIDYEFLQKRLDQILNEKEQQLFEMRFYDDMRVKDIAKVLDTSPATCATRISRIRDKVKTELNSYMKGEQ